MQATLVEVDRMDEVLLVAEARDVYFTHWILALSESLASLVMRCLR